MWIKRLSSLLPGPRRSSTCRRWVLPYWPRWCASRLQFAVTIVEVPTSRSRRLRRRGMLLAQATNRAEAADQVDWGDGVGAPTGEESVAGGDCVSGTRRVGIVTDLSTTAVREGT